MDSCAVPKKKNGTSSITENNERIQHHLRQPLTASQEWRKMPRLFSQHNLQADHAFTGQRLSSSRQVDFGKDPCSQQKRQTSCLLEEPC